MSSTTRLLVLGVVKLFQPVHGYVVRRELLSWRAQEWASVQPGSIYNALKTLCRDGLVEIASTDQVGGRPERTTYRLTAAGDEEFHALLREEWWTVRPPIDPLMAAVSFLGDIARPEAIAALEHRAATIRGMVRQLEFAIEAHDGSDSPYHVREMMRLMNARVSSELAWSGHFIEQLRRNEYATAGDPPWQPPRRGPAADASDGPRHPPPGLPDETAAAPAPARSPDPRNRKARSRGTAIPDVAASSAPRPRNRNTWRARKPGTAPAPSSPADRPASTAPDDSLRNRNTWRARKPGTAPAPKRSLPVRPDGDASDGDASNGGGWRTSRNGPATRVDGWRRKRTDWRSRQSGSGEPSSDRSTGDAPSNAAPRASSRRRRRAAR